MLADSKHVGQLEADGCGQFSLQPSVDEGVAGQPSLAIIIPTYNEAANLPELKTAIATALQNVHWEVIIVDDDSPDGTVGTARALARNDPRIRVIRRIGRRGLSSACLEGMLSSGADYFAVMDGDLQHDPALLQSMLTRICRERQDLVVASRYIDGGSVGNWSARRTVASRFATWLARRIAKVPLTDPMSGFFMIDRTVIDDNVHRFSGTGFKILLDIVMSCPTKLHICEEPLVFRNRRFGESKLSLNVAWEYFMLITEKTVGRIVPARFVAFGIIGGFGVFVHLAVLAAILRTASMPFSQAQFAATSVAIIVNYSINNILTYNDQSLQGWHWFKGLFIFALVCSIGAFANVSIASLVYDWRTSWPIAALAGIAVSSVWNYGVTARYTWGARR